jgi:heat shock protein HslJ
MRKEIAMLRRTVGGVLLFVLVAGCKTVKGGGPEATAKPSVNLEGTNWVLASDVPEGVKPPSLTLQADGHKVVGFTGCNRMFGQYTLDGHTLYFNAMGATKMACIGPAMDIEKRFLGVLTRTRSYTISGDMLSLRDDDTELLRLRAAPPDVR